MAGNRKVRKRGSASAIPRKKTARSGRNRRGRRRGAPPRTIKASLQSSAASLRLPAFADAVPLTWLKSLLALVLAPLCWVTTEAAFVSFARVTLKTEFWRSPEFFFFAMGALMWCVIFFGIRGKSLLFLYVLGHEYTHAFFALLCGARVETVQVSAGGGHILTDKNNVLISLSPYFVPFYTSIVIGLYAVTAHFLEFTQTHYRILFALIGLSWCFHFTFTVWMIFKNQPDLKQNGTFFSLTLIYLVNLVIIVTLLVVASPGLALRSFVTTWLSQAYTLPERTLQALERLTALF